MQTHQPFAARKITVTSPMTAAEIFRSPGVATVFYVYGHAMMLAFAYTAGCSSPPASSASSVVHCLSGTDNDRVVSPVFYFTSPDLGGYGFSPFQISLFLGGSGIAQAAWLLLVYPQLQKRLSIGAVLRGMCGVWILFLIGIVSSNFLLRHGGRAAFWVLAPFTLALGSGVSMQLSLFPSFCSVLSSLFFFSSFLPRACHRRLV
jgi:hypothetical protein